MVKRVCLVCFLVGVYACTPTPTQLEQALRQSGNNRAEWEKVLGHYAEDTLKYRAACFLIENMPGHYWYESEELDMYERWVDSVFADIRWDQRQMLHGAPLTIPMWANRAEKKADIECLSADFLIRHIDRSFILWRERTWLQDLSFTDFCDYILPYRFAYEKPVELDTARLAEVERITKTIESYDDIKYDPVLAAPVYSPIGHYQIISQGRDLLYLGCPFSFEWSGCIAASRSEMFNHRSMGIPAAIDFTPAFPHRNDRHYWVSVISPRFPGESTTWYKNERVGKVYRNMFAHQPMPHPRKEEFIPSFFRIPFYKDVTEKYASVAEVTIDIPKVAEVNNAYLCVFNDLEWKPVAFAEIKNGKACFKKLGRGVVYLPVVYRGQQQIPVSWPLIPQQEGGIRFLQADTTQLQTVCVKRKYPARYTFVESVRRISGCRIEASEDSLFRHPVTAGCVEYSEKMELRTVDITLDKAYRYWRLVVDDKSTSLAEMLFYDKQGKRLKKGHILKTGQPYERLERVFDDDALTFSLVMSWVGWDFGEAVSLSQVRCISRNDDNGVWPGNYYELFYQNDRGWISLGKRKAETDSLLYSNIPRNSLLLLKNYSRGREERIFTLEKNDRIRFW